MPASKRFLAVVFHVVVAFSGIASGSQGTEQSFLHLGEFQGDLHNKIITGSLDLSLAEAGRNVLTLLRYFRYEIQCPEGKLEALSGVFS
jgi:hypothetical protein